MIRGDESTTYVVPDVATIDISFIDSDVFWTSSKMLDLVACPMF